MKSKSLKNNFKGPLYLSSFAGFFCCLLQFLPLCAIGQSDTLNDKTELVDFYLSGGSSSYPVFSMSQANFKDIVPRSQLLSGEIMKVNFNDFDNDSAGGFYLANGKNTAYAQAGITLRLRNKEYKKAGPWLKLGLSYFASSLLLNTGVFRRSRLSDDSAYYVSGMPVNRKTTATESLTYAYSCQSINLESTLIYKLNPSGIFSLFGGPGAFMGLNFGGKAELMATGTQAVEDYLLLPDATQVLYKKLDVSSEQKETIDLGPNLSFGLFINVGADLRLGSQYDYIKNMHLFAEVKPMFRAYGVKGAGLQSSVILVSNLGLRYALE